MKRQPLTMWDRATDLHGLIIALQCVDNTNEGDQSAISGRAAILNVAERLAEELRDEAEAIAR